MHGPPDQIEDRTSNSQNPSEIWRYNYLENFHSSVEFEFATGTNFRPGACVSTGPPPMANVPAGHASMQTWPELQTLSVPVDSIAGAVDVESLIRTAAPNETGLARP